MNDEAKLFPVPIRAVETAANILDLVPMQHRRRAKELLASLIHAVGESYQTPAQEEATPHTP